MRRYVLGPNLGRYNNRYVRRNSFYVKESSYNWWKFYWLHNVNSSLNLFFFLCSSSLNLFFFLIIINNDKCKCIGGVCLRKSLNVSSNPSPTITTHFNVSKFSLSMSLLFPELSLLSWNTGGGLDASGSMYISLVTLKASSLTRYDSLSFAFFSFLFLLNSTSFLIALSFNWSKALIASFWSSKECEEI